MIEHDQEMQSTSCDCEPEDISDEGDGSEVIDHEADCPRYYDHLHTAEQIASFRQHIMMWSDHVGVPLGKHPLPREVAAKMAAGVTARAVELGLEPPEEN